MSVVLIEEVWNLFNSLWNTRNKILHDENGLLKTSENTQLLKQLLTYRRCSMRMLAPSDRHIIEYSISEIKQWVIIRKRRTLDILDRCRKQYKVKIQNQQNRQPTLMELGFTRIIPEDLDDVTEREPD